MTVDTRAARSTVRVPHAAWDPGGQAVRLAAGVGLWDAAAGRYLIPGRPPTRRTRRRGRRAKPPAFFNVAFRFAEPLPDVGDPHRHARRPGLVARRRPGRRAGHRRHRRSSSPTSTSASSRGRRRTTAARGVPQTGRWTASSPATSRPGRAPTLDHLLRPAPASCTGELRGRLQPYAIYVPPSRAGARLRADAAAALARRQLQPVPRQPQPVAVRRPRRRARS